VIFDEDHCRMRKKNSAKNMSVVRHLVLNMLREEKSQRISLNLKRKKAILSHKYLMKVMKIA
ncbi:MAG: ISAs1 family transposase, partial [Streptococcaceae bacterium]|nr:ISAs1 family transposase [Streptococcaceae bacterium]